MAEAAFVYALLDMDGRPRYVGHSKDVDARVSEHWKARGSIRLRRGNPAFCEWLCSIGSRPDYRVIAQVPFADRYRQEHFYTERLRAAGADLVNINSGAHLAADHLARMVAASKTPEALAKVDASRFGRKMGPETIAKMSAASKANWQDPDYRAKRVAAIRARRLARGTA